MYTVTVKTGAFVRKFLFSKPSLEIGRIQENDVVLENKRVSKRHANISSTGENITISDLNSANGVL